MLSIKFKSQVASVQASSISLDTTSKQLFTLAHNEFIKVSSENIKALRKDMNAYLKDTIKSDSIRAGVSRVLNVSQKYSELKVITYLNDLTYENIKGAITLLSYIDREYEDKSILKSVKSKLSKVKNKDFAYNNNFRTKLIELKQEYKVAITEEGTVVKLSYDKIATSVNSMSQEELNKLLGLVSSKIISEEVA